MSEFVGKTVILNTADDDGLVEQLILTGLYSVCASWSTDTEVRNRWSTGYGEPDISKYLYNDSKFTHKDGQNDTINYFACLNGNFVIAKQPKITATYNGLCSVNRGMFLVRDKLPFIAWVRTVNGSIIPLSLMILYGINNNVLIHIDRNGIAAEYLPFDTYDSGLIVSQNGMVYTIIQFSIIQEYIYDIYTKRTTKANATFRQIHRKFI